MSTGSVSIAIAQPIWQSSASEFQADLWGVSLANRDIGLAVGFDGEIVSTEDGGVTWKLQNSGSSDFLESVAYFDSLRAVAVGFHGIILHTVDGGKTWSQWKSGALLFGVSGMRNGFGIAVGAEGAVFQTNDGGVTWIQHHIATGPSLLSVALTATVALAVGDSGVIFRTTDNGNSWMPKNSGTKLELADVAFGDNEMAVAVGDSGIIITTTDNGLTWSRYETGINRFLSGVSFINRNNGLAVGEGGIVLHTVDGGKTWAKEESGTNENLIDVSIIDVNEAVIVGNNGTILHRVVSMGNGRWERIVNAGLHAIPSPVVFSTLISFFLSSASHVNLSIYNSLGEEITTLLDAPLPSGWQSALWNTAGLPSGAYYYRLVVNNKSPEKNYSETKKIMLVR